MSFIGIVLVTFIAGQSAMITAPTPFEQARLAFQQGEFESAIAYWHTALKSNEFDTSQRFDALLQLSNAYQTLGFSDEAIETLDQAESLIADPTLKTDTVRQILLFVAKSDLSLATRQEVQARNYADKSIASLSPQISERIRAVVLNNRGNVFTVEAYYDKAIQDYTDSIALAEKSGDLPLAIRARINKAHAHFYNHQRSEAASALRQAQLQLESTPIDYTRVFNLIGVGELTQRIKQPTPPRRFPPAPPVEEDRILRDIAYQTLTVALDLAKKLDNPRLISYASGYLGQLYESESRYADALSLTRQAIFFAQQIEALEILFRWQWQLGRLFKAQGESDSAIEAYRDAVENLQPIRQALAMGYRSTSRPFRETTGPVFFELADLLLKKATTALDESRWLEEARNTIESFKTAELRNYFQDDCVVDSPPELTLVNTGIYTAVIYPILLPDRIEILLSLPKGIHQFSVPVSAEQLREKVNEFRFELETQETNDFLNYSQQLYQWLIKPLEKSLSDQEISTLIIVPDDVLRTIPFVALHDGKQFLVSKYTFVTVPGLTLTDSKPTQWHQSRILLSGLSKEVAGYPALTNVPGELRTIQALYEKQATLLLNQNFTVNKFSATLEHTIYSIVHIASHGQFDSDTQKTFLLTYDGKLTMNQLEQLIRLSKLRNKPVELLTLSACKTAVGDDQAALGLAGVAIKAGARTAVASLWSIDDAATALLIGEFYRQLQHVPKAKALQNAQRYLLRESRYRHPAFWAPFLLIGNWN